ncbi:MAG: hypothetical protein H6841_00940 [Planctomycetes bacterium]|nr:hypothetical protein [Planctomycetota bacterium]MCB9935931.1 hypothetical protein [Planctomycetota bacterium]
MNRVLLACIALMVIGLAVVGCKSSNGGCKSSNGGGESGCGGSACGGGTNSGNACGGTDMADMMIKMYLDKQQKASPFVALHKVVTVGQYWETTSEYVQGTKSVTKWQVSAKAAGTKSEFIIENDMGMGYIIAYQVDAWAEAGQPNVKKAWIGKPGDKPQEIEVMEWKPGEAGEAGAINGIVLREDFKGLELAGHKFDGELTIVKSDGNTTRTWVAGNGWFNQVIKMEMNGDVVMELTGYEFEEKPKTFLKWEEDK